MKKLSVGLVLAGMLLAAEADAGSLWGAGTASCGRWVTDRRNAPSTALFEFSWVQGYITGLNSGMPSSYTNNGQVGAQLDINAAEVWLDNYCQAHPLDHLADAADQLYTYARSRNE